MKNTIRLFALISLLGMIVAAGSHAAGDISISAEVDRNTITIDEQLVLRIAVSGNVDALPSPVLPDIPGFAAYSSGRTQNVSIVNGTVSSSVTFNYILVPKSQGNHTIPPIQVIHKGQAYSTSPISIQVSAAYGTQQAGNVRQAQIEPTEEAEEFFITAQLDKKKAYVGEDITYTFKFYRRIRLLGNPQYQPPDFSGFWTEDLPPQKNYYTNLHGRQYLVTEIKTALFPLSSGKVSIQPSYLQVSIEDFSRDNQFSGSFFRNFFSGGKRVQLKTEPMELTVLPLPEGGKPSGFSGAVGKYGITAYWDKKETEAWQPVTLTVEIEGNGNIKTINRPEYPSFGQFKEYETVSSMNMSKEGYRVSGSKIFKTVLVPKKAGSFSVKDIRFSFFDPSARKYRVINAATAPLRVLQGEKHEEIISGISKEEVRLLGQDIRHLKTPEELTAPSRILYKRSPFLILQVFPLLLFFGTYGFIRRKEKLENDPELMRKKKAYVNARKNLSLALKTTAEGKRREFFITLSNALYGYIADKLLLPRAGMTHRDIAAKILDMGVDKNASEELIALLEELDIARFSGAETGKTEKEQLFTEVERTIRKLDKKIR